MLTYRGTSIIFLFGNLTINKTTTPAQLRKLRDICAKLAQLKSGTIA